MTIDIVSINDMKCTIFTVTGKVAGKQILDAHKKAIASDSFQSQQYWLIDSTQCAEFLVSPEELIEISRIDNIAAKNNPDLLMAIVASTDVQYGMSRLYSAYIDEHGFRTCVFRTREEADNWILNELKK